VAQVTFILLGWGLAQFPHLVSPDVTIQNAAAPESTQKLLLLALGAGAVVLLPSLFYSFKFSRDRNSGDAGSMRFALIVITVVGRHCSRR